MVKSARFIEISNRFTWPLFRCRLIVAGELVGHGTGLYQKEKGGWDDPKLVYLSLYRDRFCSSVH